MIHPSPSPQLFSPALYFLDPHALYFLRLETAILESFNLWRNVLISHLVFPFRFCSWTTPSFRSLRPLYRFSFLFVRSFVRSFVPWIHLFMPRCSSPCSPCSPSDVAFRWFIKITAYALACWWWCGMVRCVPLPTRTRSNFDLEPSTSFPFLSSGVPVTSFVCHNTVTSNILMLHAIQEWLICLCFTLWISWGSRHNTSVLGVFLLEDQGVPSASVACNAGHFKPTYYTRSDNHMQGCILTSQNIFRVHQRGTVEFRASHRPFYGYGRQITAIEISSKFSTVRPGKITAVNGYYGRFRVMTPISCE